MLVNSAKTKIPSKEGILLFRSLNKSSLCWNDMNELAVVFASDKLNYAWHFSKQGMIPAHAYTYTHAYP